MNSLPSGLPALSMPAAHPSLILSQSQSKSISVVDSSCNIESFTFIVMDLDDTLIPTTMRKRLLEHFEIDLFSLSSPNRKSLVLKLQLCLISALETLLSKIHTHTQLAVISNGTQKWLERMFVLPSADTDSDSDSDTDEKQSSAKSSAKKSKPTVYLPKLSAWFAAHGVEIISAVEDNLPLISQHPSLQKLKGLQTNYKRKQKSVETAKSQENVRNEKRWLLKFNSIDAAVRKLSERLKLPCARIVSFGDGWFEKEALKRYSAQTQIECVHFEFIAAPTLAQIEAQWKLIQHDANIVRKNGFYELRLMRFHSKYRVCSLEAHFDDNDNDTECTGKTHQMGAVRRYVRQWLRQQNKNRAKGGKFKGNAKVMALVNKVNARKRVLARNGKFRGSAYEKMCGVLWKEMAAVGVDC